MNFQWNHRQNELKRHFGDFGRSEVAPRALEQSRLNAFDRQSWDRLAATEFWRMIVPGDYGGNGAGWWDFSAALEGLAENIADGGFLLTLISQAGFIYGLNEFGSPEQKATYFPRILAGALTATCIAEPHSGSDMAGMQTIAQFEGGEDGTLNGRKWNIAHGPTADLYLVVGRIPALGQRDITVFILDRDRMEGIFAAEPDDKLGNRTLPTSGLQFRNVPVQKSDILGAAGNGIKTLVQIVSLDRIYYGWMGAALIAPLLESATQFVQSRQTGGKPIGRHQYVQEKLVEAIIGVQQSRFVGMGTLSQLLAGDRMALLNGSVAKLTGARTFLQSTRDLLSLFGSDGYHQGLASHLIRDALGLITVGGTEEMHRINIFNQWIRQQT